MSTKALSETEIILPIISRVPDDIWIPVFEHATSTTEGGPHIADEWVRDERTWHGTLVISLVCQTWRAIVLARPRLWTNITIQNHERWECELSRIRHYIALSGDMPKTLMATPLGAITHKQHRELLNEMGDCAPVRRIICNVQEHGDNPAMEKILSCFSPAPELWVLKAPRCIALRSAYPRIFRPYFVTVPKFLSQSVRHLVTESVKINLLGRSECRLESYVADSSPDPYTWPIELFSPASVATLSDLRFRTTERFQAIQARFYRSRTEVLPLPRVQNVHASLQYLLSYISRRYSMPALTSMTITNALDATQEGYKAFKPWIFTTKIESLTCESMEEIGPIPLLIADLLTLSSLELHGKSVERVLSSLVVAEYEGGVAALPSLKQLIISSYSGEAEAIVAFLHWWKGYGQKGPDLRRLNVTIMAEECPGLSLEMRKNILVLSQATTRQSGTYESL